MSRIASDLDQRLARYAALVLRIGLGAVMIAHALLKLLVFTLPGTAANFEAHGFPGWTAYPVTGIELVGGTLLILGVAVRGVSVVLIPVMFGAVMFHWENGWMFHSPHGGWEYTAFLIVALIAQTLLGGGAASVWPR